MWYPPQRSDDPPPPVNLGRQVAPHHRNRLRLPPVTYPAVFAVPDGGALTTALSVKARRPGLIACAGFLDRNGDEIVFPVDLELWRPRRFNVPRSIRRLVIASDFDGMEHMAIEAGRGQFLWRFPGLIRAPDVFCDRAGDTRCEVYVAPDDGKPLNLRIVPHGLPGFQREARRDRPPPFPAGRPAPPWAPTEPRHELELWLCLNNQDDGGETQRHDLLLITVAPVVISSDAGQPERLFAVPMLDVEADFNLGAGNFGTMFELARIAHQAGVACTFLSPQRVDVWGQDGVVLGHAVGPGFDKPVVVMCNRRKNNGVTAGTERYVEEYQPDDQTGLYPDLFDVDRRNSMDWGGNVIVTPPIARGTDRVDRDEGGAGISAHPPAPYGKIVVGDAGAGYERPTQATRAFLHAQKAQPVVSVDTSWLHVKHTDEILCVVPAPQRCPFSGRGSARWVLLMADPQLATRLLLLADAIGGREVVRGSRWQVDLQQYTLTNNRYRPLDAGAHGWVDTLSSIRRRLIRALDLDAATDILPMPVLFTPGAFDAAPAFPNMVNCVPLGARVIVPKPWGPRLPLGLAKRVLCSLPTPRISKAMFGSAGLSNHRIDEQWAFNLRNVRPGEDEELWDPYGPKAATRCRAVQVPGDAFPNAPDGLPDDWQTVPDGWRRYQIELKRVDIFEAYVRVMFSGLGLAPHFVDDWAAYHRKGGELHCGTKVRRAAMVVQDGQRWWQRWDELRAVTEADP